MFLFEINKTIWDVMFMQRDGKIDLIQNFNYILQLYNFIAEEYSPKNTKEKYIHVCNCKHDVGECVDCICIIDNTIHCIINTIVSSYYDAVNNIRSKRLLIKKISNLCPTKYCSSHYNNLSLLGFFS